MRSQHDVIVLGLGGIGSAVANDLAMKGHRVLGIEQFAPVHDLGSSHGETRAIRKAYFEDPKYVPLVLRSYELWQKLEAIAGHRLLEKSGCVIMGPPQSKVIEGCLKSAKAANLPYKMLSATELSSLYGFKLPSDYKGFFEPDGGYLHVEKCVDFMIKNAVRNGADLVFKQKMLSWRNKDKKIEVIHGDQVYTAQKLIVCAGPWTGKFLEPTGFTLPLSVKRAAMFWFNKGMVNANIPVFFQHFNQGPWIYGFPNIGKVIKVAFHNVFTDCDPDTVDREIHEDEVKSISGYAKELLPKLGAYSRAKTCMYTMTPDENFILGTLQGENSNVFLACGFSGHGFKFAPVVGEIASNFVEGKKQHDIEFLSPYRF
jgi:sarcosine oxidase